MGLAGLVGSGRTQLAEVLFGLESMDQGEVFITGKNVSIQSPADAVSCGLAYVPEDRRKHGVILGMSIAANTTLASLRQISRHGFLSTAIEQERAEELSKRLAVKAPDIGTAT